MKLERFKEKKQKKMGIIVGTSSIVLLFALVFVYRTYSLYQEKQEFDVIKGSVPDQNYDVMFTFYLLEQDGTKKIIETIPEGKNYHVGVECNQEANGVWDEEKWGPVITNLTNTRTKCEIIFEKLHGPLEDYGIDELEVVKGSGLYKVSHEDASITYTNDVTAIANLKKTEYRYAGSSPNNYVTFNGEVAGWRLIGLVNTPEGQRLKLIRDESIGDYSWDSSAASINNGWGINEWNVSKIKILLNDLYFLKQNGACYKGANNTVVNCDFSEIGLNVMARNHIDDVVWNVGANGNIEHDIIVTKQFYNLERSNNIGKACSGGIYCNDNINRTTTWRGKVGLMYPSDYGYAISGSENISRDRCLNKALNKWNEIDSEDCINNNWLNYLAYQWMMMPRTSSSSSIALFDLTNLGNVAISNALNYYTIRPVVYLKNDVLFIEGTGTQDNPYVLYNS